MTHLKRLTMLILLGINLISLVAQENTRSLTDALNRKISFEKTPTRVITLAPSLTEFIYLLNCDDKLIGNTLYCNYPAEANEITKIGDMITFDFEKILSLNPDLLLITVEGNTKEAYEKLESFGLKTFVLNPRNINDIKKSLVLLSGIFSKEVLADSIIKNWDKEVEEVKKHNELNKSRSAMVIIDISPLMLAGKNTFINEYLEICNLDNITEASPSNYPVFSREEIIKRNPDVIIYPGNGTEDVGFLLSYYPEWNELKAIKNKKVIFVDRDTFSRPGPRFIKALEELSEKIN